MCCRPTSIQNIANGNFSKSIKIVLLITCLLNHNSYVVFGINSTHPQKMVDADPSPDPELKPEPEEINAALQSDLMTNNTASNDTSIEADQTPSEIDEEWMADAIKDVAYYLRSHKFNDYDRRYLTQENDTGRIFFEEFPEPPLRVVHWEIQKHCENNFTDCLKFLHERVLQADLKRADDTITIKRENGWTHVKNSKDINSTDTKCKILFEQEKTNAKPFLGPLERFQWRTSASYYMCWFTMKQTPQLMLFGEPCDNFANCLDPTYGESNKDPRADDRLPFQCAAYSFCPDPCCPKKHITSIEECWSDTVNPCYNEAPQENRKCVFNSENNTDFQSLVTNKWNVSCTCSQEGFEWSSRFGICIDVDECIEHKDTCDIISEACFNLPGSYVCGCNWGYQYSAVLTDCVRDEALYLPEIKEKDTDTVDKMEPVSLVKLIKNARSKKKGKNEGHRFLVTSLHLLQCLIPLLVAEFII